MHHLVRRAALRAASATPSFASTPRSITTVSPFLRSRLQTTGGVSSSIFRRFASDEASPESAEGEKPAVSSAIDSAAESGSTYAGDAAENLASSAERTGENIVDAANETAAAAGRAFRPRSFDRGNVRDFGDDHRGGFRNRRERPTERPSRDFQPNPTLYIGNLLFDITNTDLEREFAEFGTITASSVATDARGLSKGFGYVTFETVEQATAAIQGRHETVFEGRNLVVNYASPQRQQIRGPTEPSKTLFLGNLAFEMSDSDINNLFRDVKNVIDVRVAIDRRTGQPRGFAHAEFLDEASAGQAMEQLKDQEIYGRKLRVDYSAGKKAHRSQ